MDKLEILKKLQEKVEIVGISGLTEKEEKEYKWFSLLYGKEPPLHRIFGDD
jgi:hypothetical protein